MKELWPYYQARVVCEKYDEEEILSLLNAGLCTANTSFRSDKE